MGTGTIFGGAEWFAQHCWYEWRRNAAGGCRRRVPRECAVAVEEEPDTTAWFALRFGPATFGIFDAFPDDAGRQAHLAGKVAQALMARADELFVAHPTITKVDVLASKLRAETTSRYRHDRRPRRCKRDIRAVTSRLVGCVSGDRGPDHTARIVA